VNVRKQLLPVLELIDMPKPIEGLLAQWRVIEGARAKVAQERQRLGEQPMATAAIRAGGDPIKAAEAQLAWAARRNVIDTAGQAGVDAYEAMELRAIPQALAAAADELIEGPIRDKVTALVEQARPLADILAEFAAERFDPAHIAQHGSASQFAAYQAAAPLQAQYDVLRGFWGSLWDGATGGAGRRELRALRPRPEAALLVIAAGGPFALPSVAEVKAEADAAKRAEAEAARIERQGRRGVRAVAL
jgi:hypothetical protein